MANTAYNDKPLIFIGAIVSAISRWQLLILLFCYFVVYFPQTTNNDALNSSRKENESLKENLKTLEEQQTPGSPGRSRPYHGRWSAMRSESRKVRTFPSANTFQ